MEQPPGFVDYYVLETDDGGLIAINIYEDKAGIEASKKFSAKWNKEQSEGTLPEKPGHAFEGRILIHHSGKKRQAAA